MEPTSVSDLTANRCRLPEESTVEDRIHRYCPVETVVDVPERTSHAVDRTTTGQLLYQFASEGRGVRFSLVSATARKSPERCSIGVSLPYKQYAPGCRSKCLGATSDPEPDSGVSAGMRFRTGSRLSQVIRWVCHVDRRMEEPSVPKRSADSIISIVAIVCYCYTVSICAISSI